MVVHAVKWTEDLAVGVDVLDNDHRRLVILMNKVIAAFYAGVGSRMVNAAMDELEAYTREHFTREEEMIEGKGYAELESHKEQHGKLIAELARLRAVKSGTEVIPLLYDWLVTHIMKTDKGYSHLFQ
ncbi:MAG: hemerythrin family protein [Alphaproteobacteria bacterium]|nr:hemerythrin family protein [Alphaproteobacteria bacterium]